MMKTIKYLFLAFVAVCLMLYVTACDPDAVANTKKVTIEFDTISGRVSAGFCQVHFATNKEAYYYVGMAKVRYRADGSEINPMDYENQFMTLALDTAYIEYLHWRYNLLEDGCDHIASFSDHSLQYGNIDYTFTRLEANTRYWLYAFVVNHKTNAPYGKLYLKTITTPAKSVFMGDNAVNFTYRVEGLWDYVYPYNVKSSQLITYVPWVGMTADSLVIRNAVKDVDVAAALGDAEKGPGYYFGHEFYIHESVAANRILYGIYAHCNDGFGDQTTDTHFQVGHTYYTAMSIDDGNAHATDSYDIYKFTYTGENTRIVLKHESSTKGYWNVPE